MSFQSVSHYKMLISFFYLNIKFNFINNNKNEKYKYIFKSFFKN